MKLWYVRLALPADFHECIKWCRDNDATPVKVGSLWHEGACEEAGFPPGTTGAYFAFISADHAMLFKLAWG